MWHCADCYNVFHFRCIRTWAMTNSSYILHGFRRYPVWKCPYCLVIHGENPKATCWCGKQPFDPCNPRSDIPNACPSQCGKTGMCKHENRTEPCMNRCHPGPCNWPCKAICADLPADYVPKKPNAWGRFRRRWQQRKRGTVTCALGWTICVAGAYSFIIKFTLQHIKWWTQPYNFKYFTEVLSDYECLALLLVGMLVCFPVVTITIVVWLSAVGGLLNTLLNLDNRETKEKLKSWTQGLGKVFLGLIAVAFIVIPIVAWVPRQVTACSILTDD